MYPILASTVARNQKCLDYSILFISLFHFPMFWKALNTEECNAIYVKLNSCRQISFNCVSVFLCNNPDNYFYFYLNLSLPFHKVTSLLIPILSCKNASLQTYLLLENALPQGSVIGLRCCFWAAYSSKLNDGAF